MELLRTANASHQTARLHVLGLVSLVLFFVVASTKPSFAEEPAHALQKVQFESRGDTLSGWVAAPEGPGPFPAFVLIQGSGSVSIHASWSPERFPFWKDITDELVRRGFLVLAFDKPGVGESTGSWQAQSFDDRAQNVLDAVRFLRTRSDVDHDRIGAIGHSQGGWIAQMLVARTPEDIAFAISLAGPSISVREQIIDDMAGGWQCGGLTGWATSVSRFGTNILLGAYGLVSHVVPIGYLGKIVNYEPSADIKQIRQPFLAIFAENDRLVYPEKNASLMRTYLEQTESDRWSIETVPGANHSFMPSDFCESNVERRWADGFWEAFSNEAFWSHVQ